MSRSFPDTKLAEGEVDPLRGGQASRFLNGALWDFLWNLLFEISTQLVAHFWAPYDVKRVTAGDAWSAGDVIVESLSGAGTDYTLLPISKVTYAPDTTPRYGLAAESAAAGAKAKVIPWGAGIPPAIHGLAAGAAGYVRMNTTTGRLERATGTPGEVVIGTINTKGYVRLAPCIPGVVE